MPLIDFVRDVSGGNPKMPQSDYLESGSLPVVDQGRNFIAGFSNDQRYKFQSSDLPVVIFGDHTRAVKYVDFPFVMGADGVKVLKPTADLDAKFLYHFLRHAHIPNAGYSRHYKFVKELKLRVPDLDEQRRITAILDKAEELLAKRRETISRLELLGEAAFVELFGDPIKNSMRWPMQLVREVVTDFVGGKNLACPSESASPYRILRVSAVTSKTYRPSESKPAPDDFTPSPRAIVRPGDLLFSRANTSELVAATAYVWETPPNIVLPDKLWKLHLSPSAQVTSLFLSGLFKNKDFRTALTKLSSGTSGSMKNISKEKLRSVPLPIPPLATQEIFSKISRDLHRQSQLQEHALRKAEDLFFALQAQAFGGTL